MLSFVHSQIFLCDDFQGWKTFQVFLTKFDNWTWTDQVNIYLIQQGIASHFGKVRITEPRDHFYWKSPLGSWSLTLDWTSPCQLDHGDKHHIQSFPKLFQQWWFHQLPEPPLLEAKQPQIPQLLIIGLVL